MLGTTCVIGYCKNNFLRTKKAGLNISYYRFPVEEELLMKWKDRCGLKPNAPTKSARICSAHFKDEDFNQIGTVIGRRTLKADAAPSIYLTEEDQPKSKSTRRKSEKGEGKGSSKEFSEDDSDGIDALDIKEEDISDAELEEQTSQECDDFDSSNETTKANNLKRKRNASPSSSQGSNAESDIEALELASNYSSDESMIHCSDTDSWDPEDDDEISKKNKKPKKTPRKKVKLYDFSSDSADVLNKFEDEDNEDDECENEDEDNPFARSQSLGSLLKEGKLPDKEAVIKLLEQKILEHSKIIEEKYVQPLPGKGKKKKKDSTENQPPVKDDKQMAKVVAKENGNEMEIASDLDNSNPPPSPVITPSSEINIQHVKHLLSLKVNACNDDGTPKTTAVNKSPSAELENPDDANEHNADSIPVYHITESAVKENNLPQQNSSDKSEEKFDKMKTKYNDAISAYNSQTVLIKKLEKSLQDAETELVAVKGNLKSSTTKNEELHAKINKMETALSKMLTPNQIKLLLNDCKKVAWTPQEMLSAFTIRFLSRRCYYYLRQKLNYPLPGISSVQRWASQMTKQHGNLNNVHEAVNQFVKDGSDDDGSENETILYYPNVSSQDVFVEGTIDEINAHSEDPKKVPEKTKSKKKSVKQNKETKAADNSESQAHQSWEQENNQEGNERIIYLQAVEDPNLINEVPSEHIIQETPEDEDRKPVIQYKETFKQEPVEEANEGEGSLLKALLTTDSSGETTAIIQTEEEGGESGNRQEYLGIIHPADVEDGEEEGDCTQKVILLETFEGVNPEDIQWHIADGTLEGEGNYIIAEESADGQAIAYFAQEHRGELANHQILTADPNKPDDQGTIAIYNQGVLQEDCKRGDEILHYLYGISEMSPLKVNNSLDHSYAIATLDKYIRTKERHKNRKPPKKPTAPTPTTPAIPPSVREVEAATAAIAETAPAVEPEPEPEPVSASTTHILAETGPTSDNLTKVENQ